MLYHEPYNLDVTCWLNKLSRSRDREYALFRVMARRFIYPKSISDMSL